MCRTTSTFHACGHLQKTDLHACTTRLAPEHFAPIPQKQELATDCTDCARMSPEERAAKANQLRILKRKDAAELQHIALLQAAMQDRVQWKNMRAANANRRVGL